MKGRDGCVVERMTLCADEKRLRARVCACVEHWSSLLHIM